MVVTFWALFFFVMFLMLVVLAFMFCILDGIRYHEEEKQRRFEELSGQDPDWMNDDGDIK